MHLMTPETATPEHLRVSVQMLQKTTSKVGKLQREFPSPAEGAEGDRPKAIDMMKLCGSVRQTLELLLRARGEQKAGLEFELLKVAD